MKSNNKYYNKKDYIYSYPYDIDPKVDYEFRLDRYEKLYII